MPRFQLGNRDFPLSSSGGEGWGEEAIFSRARTLDNGLAGPHRAVATFGFRPSFGFRISDFGFGVSGFGLLLATALVFQPLLALGQPKVPAPAATPVERAEGERLAHELIANLLSQRPSQSSSNVAVLKIRDGAHHVRELFVSFQIVPAPTNYVTIYEVLPSATGPGGPTLSITHAGERPNEYLLFEPGRESVRGESLKLGGPQLMAPFAGSDFWVADLGLDFLHWPEQRVLKKEMRKGQFCAVLQSVNPHPENSGYGRVVSWIGINHPEDTVIVHADGYDAAGKLIKEFDPKKLEKVNGLWQLEEMEMVNRQTNSRTTIEFQLRDQAAVGK